METGVHPSCFLRRSVSEADFFLIVEPRAIMGPCRDVDNPLHANRCFTRALYSSSGLPSGAKNHGARCGCPPITAGHASTILSACRWKSGAYLSSNRASSAVQPMVCSSRSRSSAETGDWAMPATPKL